MARHQTCTPMLTTPYALAYGFAALHHRTLRYVAAWKRWLAWDGQCWRNDDTGLALHHMQDVCADMLHAARGKPALAKGTILRLGSPGTVNAVERLARLDRKLAAAPALFDVDPNLLNTPAGIVDLRTGETSPHRAEDYLARITPVASAAPGTPCRAWSSWLERLSGGDAQLPFFLQRAVGRALAQRRPSNAAPGILSETLARVLGDDSAAASLGECLALLPRRVRRADQVCDPDLKDRLAVELPAILRWAIDGALAWRQIGLAPPAALQPAADAGDALDRWLDEATEPAPGAWTSAGALYAQWCDWAERSGEPVGSHKRFSLAMAARGFSAQRAGSGTRGFAGLKLRETSVGSVEAADPRPTATSLRPGHIVDDSPLAREPGLPAEARHAPALLRSSSFGGQPSLADRAEAAAP